jgi:hypothetical protein
LEGGEVAEMAGLVEEENREEGPHDHRRCPSERQRLVLLFLIGSNVHHHLVALSRSLFGLPSPAPSRGRAVIKLNHSACVLGVGRRVVAVIVIVVMVVSGGGFHSCVDVEEE